MNRPKTLTAAFVKSINRAGRYGDGRGSHGLSLLVKPMLNGRLSRTWSQRLRLDRQPFNIGLGSFPIVGLAEARRRALENRRAVERGEDPRKPKFAVPTFAQAAETVIALHAPGWKDSGRTAKNWRSSLESYAFPVIGKTPVDKVTTADIMAVLFPIWATKSETSRRLKIRISQVMKWAIGQGFRPDDPAGPALLAAMPKKNGHVEHQKALPHADVAKMLKTIEGTNAWDGTKLAIRFIALTATRSSEVRLATWAEIDLGAGVWEIPGERMKGGREHRVPLSDAVLDVLREARALGDGELLFPSITGKPLSDNALSLLFRRHNIPSTIHGLRSSFRDWCGENGVSREVAEACLAHHVSGVEGAYFRSDLFERRREVMQTWGEYVSDTGKSE